MASSPPATPPSDMQSAESYLNQILELGEPQPFVIKIILAHLNHPHPDPYVIHTTLSPFIPDPTSVVKSLFSHLKLSLSDERRRRTRDDSEERYRQYRRQRRKERRRRKEELYRSRKRRRRDYDDESPPPEMERHSRRRHRSTSRDRYRSPSRLSRENSPDNRLSRPSPRDALNDRSPRHRRRDLSPRDRVREDPTRDRRRDRSPRDRGRDRSPRARGRDHSPKERKRDHSPRERGRNRSPRERGPDRSPEGRNRGFSPADLERGRRRNRSPRDRRRDRSPDPPLRDQSPRRSYARPDKLQPRRDGAVLREGASSPRVRNGPTPHSFPGLTEENVKEPKSQGIQRQPSQHGPQHEKHEDIESPKRSSDPDFKRDSEASPKNSNKLRSLRSKVLASLSKPAENGASK